MLAVPSMINTPSARPRRAAPKQARRRRARVDRDIVPRL